MLEAVGSQVMRLERVAVGGIEMDAQLEPGAWRMLTNAEVKRGLAYEPKTFEV
jgi:16S rRNA U516 pseudouridylate synthase RsuA-like enzyme